ncbi:flippase [Treponema ruminis]|uniref:O-antigen/teichoic acid export membrane protein n=1 Tax=Treponema ruminis TaxID=744515 RepID=A0A7W8G9Y9_9SPIR|nr:oligosaccharide flippase family protein [Treponema ruminis]MBB5226588.1 O-antigen/teichoic acid export membrane protein [Treponema ruminis]QSI02182.1 flippase [Treponema ruminis]
MQTKSIKINAVLNVIRTCSTIFFPLITYPYVLRILMPENIGKVNFANSFISYFSLIAGLGIGTYAIRECAKVRDNKEMLDNISSQIFSMNLLTTFIAYILLFLSLFFFRKLDNYRVLIIVYGSSIIFTTLGADWINTAMEDFFYIAIRTILFQILHVILIFVFVRTSNDYYKYAVISIMSASGANIANIFYRRKYCKMKLIFKIEWKKHLAPIIYLFVMILSQTIFNTADVTMLGLMKDDYAVGIYSTAVKINNLISQLIASVLFVLLPKLSNIFANEDYERINSVLRKILGYILLLGIPCYAGATVLSDEIILLIGGSQYIESPLVLKILLIAFLFSLVGGSFLGNIVLLPSGNEKKFMFICCITAAFNVITNYFFIPFFGVYAAAMTTAVSSLLILILLIITVDKRIKINKKSKIFLEPVFGSIIITIICLLLKKCVGNLIIRTVVCMIFSAFVYTVILLLFRNEFLLEIINSIKQKVMGLKNGL